MIFFKKTIVFCVLFLGTQSSYIHPETPKGLIKLEKELLKDFEYINYPALPFGSKENLDYNNHNTVYDVAIIGGGMAGLTAAAALFMEGIYHVQIFDENPEGFEGPWLTYARMKTLRSPKTDMGPALGIPKLTFQAWYEALFGRSSWKELDKIPTALWMEYLVWYRDMLKIPVENNCKLVSVNYEGDHFELELNCKNATRYAKAVKVVLATGRSGFGGPNNPGFVKEIPKEKYSHVIERIDFTKLKDKSIGIVGGGSSAFDAAATALEQGAKKVDLLIRTACLPCVNKLSNFHPKCLGLGYLKMSDEWRWKIMNHVLTCTTPAPIASLKRVQIFQNFFVKSNTMIKSAKAENSKIYLKTNQGDLSYDYLILATGYRVNGRDQPELQNVIEHILLWKDRSVELCNCNPELGCFPYLGTKFEFLEKIPGAASYLKDLHCFNYASTISHGAVCWDIAGISLGAKRLAEGIAADFLDKQKDLFLESIENTGPDFNPDDFFPQKET